MASRMSEAITAVERSRSICGSRARLGAPSLVGRRARQRPGATVIENDDWSTEPQCLGQREPTFFAQASEHGCYGT